MSVTALGSFQQLASTQAYAGQQVNKQPQSTGSTAPVGKNGNNFIQSISSALSQLGVGPTTTGNDTDGAGATASTSATTGTTSTSSSQSKEQALQAFVQNLLAAIQSQLSGSGSSSGSGHHHHGAGGVGKVESGIQDLINQLSSSTTTPGAGPATAVSSTTGTNPLAALQSSFNNLLSVDGISGSGKSLSGFLQNLETNLQGSGISGNVVQTKA